MLRHQFQPYLEEADAGGGAAPAVPAEPAPANEDLSDDEQSFLRQFLEDAGAMRKDAEPDPEPQEAPKSSEPSPVPAPDFSVPIIEPLVDQPEPELPPEAAADKKAAHAFGQMRTQNSELKSEVKQLHGLIDRMSEMFNLDPHLDPKQKASVLEDAALAYMAHQQKLPLEVMKQLKDNEARLRAVELKEVEFFNNDQFDQIQKQYKLSDTEIEQFKAELVQNGVDFHTQKKLLLTAYRDYHQEDIIRREAQRLLAEELERQKKVAEHASTPASKGTPAEQNMPAGGGQKEFKNNTEYKTWLARLEREGL